jgi:hypothetical protein
MRQWKTKTEMMRQRMSKCAFFCVLFTRRGPPGLSFQWNPFGTHQRDTRHLVVLSQAEWLCMVALTCAQPPLFSQGFSYGLIVRRYLYGGRYIYKSSLGYFTVCIHFTPQSHQCISSQQPHVFSVRRMKYQQVVHMYFLVLYPHECMCMCEYACIYICVHVYLCLCLHVHICISVCLHVHGI